MTNTHSRTEQDDDNVRDQLNALRKKTGAHCVLLLRLDGYPIEVSGIKQDFDISNLCTLITANFASAREVADVLDGQSAFNSSYHEGNSYNIYSRIVDDNHLLSIVFGANKKPGIVWFYTKRTAEALAPLVDSGPDRSSEFAMPNDFESTLDDEFEALFSGNIDAA